MDLVEAVLLVGLLVRGVSLTSGDERMGMGI
jgi:hypothetical protein